MENLKIGLLPLYLKLYDDTSPKLRERIDSFHHTIAGELGKRGLEVVSTPVCRIKAEFEQAIRTFEEEEVDAVVTLHLAYSPSLEASSVLAATDLPLVILDTTPTFHFNPGQHPDEIMFNHGIHGVQDMCNLLIRNGKAFLIESGHWAESDVLERIADCVKASRIAGKLKQARVGRLGNPFQGMGDFAVPSDVLRSTIGISTIPFDLNESGSLFEEVTAEQIDEEIAKDKQDFHLGSFDNNTHRQSADACLRVRKLIETNNLTAFTVNFMEVTKESVISSMPFLEASKAMSRGIGYAGEGDVLTAALVGALLSVYPETSFTEMFCPDWKNNRIFLSHMGEMNLQVTARKPVLQEMNFPYTDADNPVVAYGRFRGGKAVYVCLAPGKDNTYSLILSPIDMLEVNDENWVADTIHGWFRTGPSVADFLAAFSKHGGIHHGAIVYGDVLKVMEQFGEVMGWNVVKIE
ncbi:L-arabinose isomerase family protein [Paenibacillus nasutitermitis]|uniref:L-arabinose isomerase n=1 Tax=Paenibacillus nasutitermitis TaxID=1652958 RepID=A0A917DP74_9BACL|nr:hypothetical protein [Paenibacillus nasutitermitis]GGD53163.1 hypothetical protein GCM10010911_08400 [Paenibacillus nasutitermitis]